MSKCTVRHTPRNNNQAAIDKIALLGSELMTASLEQAGQILRVTSNLLAGGLSDLSSSKRSACCGIPETDCPPRCACEVHWEASPGEHLRSTIRVTNTSEKQTRNFQFTATAFQGPGNPQVRLTVSPSSATLEPGQSALVTAEFTPTDAFQPGQTYKAEVLIEGAYEQCVCFEFEPLREMQAECEVKQGDPPTQLRAHQWFDHFQCAEPCFPAHEK
jgi:hypothetical protein